MTRRKSAITLFGILFAMAVFSHAAAAAVSCESLASLSLPNATITSAKTVAAGAFAPPARGVRGNPFGNLPAFCRVTATLKPSSDSDIKMEVWLPATGWNGNFQGHGSGGMGGAIPLADMAKTLGAGFATAGSDTGHEGDSRYAMDHPERVIDFGYRAAHEMTVKAKAVIAAFYGNGPKLSFLDGCGGSAATAETEMHRYPADYDGISITGFSQKTRHASEQMWIWYATHKDAASNLPPEKLTVLHNAVLQTCDALDGVKDGFIQNPPSCKFDPKVVQCKDADGPSCLTAAQVEAVRKIYAGPTNPRTGEQLFFPPQLGSELPWSQFTGPQPFGLASDFFKYFVYKNPNWDGKNPAINYDTDWSIIEKPENLVVNGGNPDIKEFVKRGGKLLLYEGWADGTIPSGVAIDYYKKVTDTVGAKAAQDSVRLFMVPGLTHCQAATDEYSAGWHGTMVGELNKWINNKKPPERIIASSSKDGKVVRTRPLCPYPQVTTYKGTGSTDDAADFVCKAP
jgi:feruloyl esterase